MALDGLGGGLVSFLDRGPDRQAPSLLAGHCLANPRTGIHPGLGPLKRKPAVGWLSWVPASLAPARHTGSAPRALRGQRPWDQILAADQKLLVQRAAARRNEKPGSPQEGEARLEFGLPRRVGLPLVFYSVDVSWLAFA